MTTPIVRHRLIKPRLSRRIRMYLLDGTPVIHYRPRRQVIQADSWRYFDYHNSRLHTAIVYQWSWLASAQAIKDGHEALWMLSEPTTYLYTDQPRCSRA